ncbi:hypothetical protein [Streptomyces noursei]|uniref:hypothetical protein n=1 Tax=Streptomyces noursei TaxID=1971 RepID=UPI0016797A03|nr:hypothetical protein [Streptomyces noursei]MCZ1013981.1 hypothetical protein [Streptomyces noursei]GGX40423.1 hypothetical protein GCM10010341_72910 [Streptomyces noursei]
MVSKWSCPWATTHADGLVTSGSTEPVLSALELRGFEIRDMFLIGFNPDCGSIVFESEARAWEVKAALEPAYRVTVKRDLDDWVADFDRRQSDGSVPDWFVRAVALSDGTVVMRDGRKGGAR